MNTPDGSTRVSTSALAIALVVIAFQGAVPPRVTAQPQPGEKSMPAPEDVAAPPASAKKTASGLAYRVLTPGTGKVHPQASDMVKVHYTGWTTDGKMFDSSVVLGEPASFPLNRVIARWTEGVQLMVEGEKTRLWIPEALAYKGKAGAPAGMLVFDVELPTSSRGRRPRPTWRHHRKTPSARPRGWPTRSCSPAKVRRIRPPRARSPCTIPAGRQTDVEAELGIADWVDPDTGEPAEDDPTRIEEH